MKGVYEEMKKMSKMARATLLVAVMGPTSLPFVALAQESEAPQRQAALTERVAEILGIDQQEWEDALKQARTESAKGNLDARLQELIADGTLTQEQADELKTWLNARPDVPMVPPGKLDEALEKGTITQEQVDEGKITQEQLAAFKEWTQARPDMPKIRPELRKNRAQNIQENHGNLMARVADILGIDVEDLENAFKQAQRELRESALDARLQELVDQGDWTQQQADAYKAWIQARPDVPPLGPERQKGPQAPEEI